MPFNIGYIANYNRIHLYYIIYCIYLYSYLYSFEYNNGLKTEKREIAKKVFEILYTKLHFCIFTFCIFTEDEHEIIHFVKSS